MGEGNADPHPAASLLAFGLRFVDRENVLHLFLLCARCSRASDPLPDFVEILATVVLEEGTDLAGASIEHWARPKLLARVQNPSVQIQVKASTRRHVAGTFRNCIAASTVESAAIWR